MKRKFYSLIHSKDIFNFAEIKGEILNILMDKKTENCVRNLIEEIFLYVSQPMWEKKLLNPLTTNQSESFHHVFKNYVNWTKTNIAELINNLKSMVKFQYDNLKYSMYDQGDYKLHNFFHIISFCHSMK